MAKKFYSGKRNFKKDLIAAAGLTALLGSCSPGEKGSSENIPFQNQEKPNVEDNWAWNMYPSMKERGIENKIINSEGRLEITFAKEYLNDWKNSYMEDGRLDEGELTHLASYLFWNNAFEFDPYVSPNFVPQEYRVSVSHLDGVYEARIEWPKTGKGYSLKLDREWNYATLSEEN